MKQDRFVRLCRSPLTRYSAIVQTVAILLGSLVLSGCQASRYAERFGLGTIDRQKAKAAEFDPYPLNDIGPSVVGGRPPGFFNPLPEPRRNELMGKNPPYGAGYPSR